MTDKEVTYPKHPEDFFRIPWTKEEVEELEEALDEILALEHDNGVITIVPQMKPREINITVNVSHDTP